VRSSFLRQLDLMTRRLIPLLLTLVLVVLGAVPLHLPQLPAIGATLALASVFYWSFHFPILMPSAAVFALGVVSDLLCGVPLGVGVLAFMLVHGVALVQGRFFPEAMGLMVWAGFMVAAAVAGVAVWLVASLLAGSLMEPLPVFAHAIAGILCYPILAWVMARIERMLLAQA